MNDDGVIATERSDPRTDAIDSLEPQELATLLARAHGAAVDAVAAASAALAQAIIAVARAIDGGGTVVQLGAGTSGRLAVLDASELLPTFGLDPQRVQGRIAGGDAALRTAVEGAEDDAAAGHAAVAGLGPGDCVIGISASGGAPYVCGALRAARAAGATTIAIVNVSAAPLLADADIPIVLPTGAEPITGSTRLVAGTAQKIALNTISTGAMIRLGKTYRNRMVDLVATNAKLRARSERLVREIGGAAEPRALLDAAGGHVKTAIVMARLQCDRSSAEARLAAASGRLAAVIDPN